MEFNHSPEQKEVLAQSKMTSRAIMIELMAAARIAHNAIHRLPHENPDGTRVKHGANMDVVQTRDSLIGSAERLKWSAGLDYWDWVKFRFKYAAINGARFFTDEEWAAECGHLDAEIERLSEKILNGTDR